MKKEIWKNIIGYEGLYQISNLGRVKSLDRIVSNTGNFIGLLSIKEKELKPMQTKKGYFLVALYKNGTRKYYSIARLVATAFIKDTEARLQVNHKNGNKEDNSYNNLEWISCKENINHAIRNGLRERIQSDLIFYRTKKTIQYSRNKESLNLFESIASASRHTGIGQGAISNCCRGITQTAGGFLWKFV